MVFEYNGIQMVHNTDLNKTFFHWQMKLRTDKATLKIHKAKPWTMNKPWAMDKRPAKSLYCFFMLRAVA